MNVHYLTTAELAALLRVNAHTVSDRASAGDFPGAVKVGNKWRFPADTLDRAAAGETAPPRVRKRRAA